MAELPSHKILKLNSLLKLLYKLHPKRFWAYFSYLLLFKRPSVVRPVSRAISLCLSAVFISFTSYFSEAHCFSRTSFLNIKYFCFPFSKALSISLVMLSVMTSLSQSFTVLMKHWHLEEALSLQWIASYPELQTF